jgi:hypothetical protein
MTKSAAFALTDSHGGQVCDDDSSSTNASERQRRDLSRGHKTKIKYRRRTIELHPDMEKMLESLQYELRLKNHTEVMQKAIQLLAFVMGEEDGKKKRVYIEKENGNLRELIIL